MTKTAVRDGDYPDKKVDPSKRSAGNGLSFGYYYSGDFPMDSNKYVHTTNTEVTFQKYYDSLTVGTTEPPEGSVVLTADGVAYQRNRKTSDMPQYWCGTDGTYTAWTYLLRRKVSLLHRAS